MLIHLAVYYPESLYPLQIRNGIIKGLQIFAVLDLASLHKKIEINKKDRIHVCIENNLKYVYFFLFFEKKIDFIFFVCLILEATPLEAYHLTLWFIKVKLSGVVVSFLGAR